MSNVDTRGAIADRGGIWPIPFDRAERVMLTTQAKYDRRAIPPLWFWRLMQPEEGAGATAQDEALWESARPHRRYAEPIPVHIYVDWTPEKKGKKGATVETTGVAPVGWSRAEARRVGRLLGTRDDVEGLAADAVRDELVFIPRAGDLFLARGRYYAIQQMKPEWWGATSIIGTWKGASAMIRDDAGAPGLGNLARPPSPSPPLPEVVPWLA